MTDTHTQHEDHPWTIVIPDHPPREDSPGYVDARRHVNQMARSVPDFLYGGAPYQDHHGGGLWLKDDEGWFLVRNLAGIEWSAQFCADPAKVDRLRLNARRLYQAFPDAVAELGIRELLDTPIVDAAGVARWTDSICNASVPLPAPIHTGVLPGASTGGIHHYPSPIAEIELFKRDDFDLWVTPAGGGAAAVVPVAPRGSGDGRTRLLFAAVPPEMAGSELLARLSGHAPRRQPPTAVEGMAGEARPVGVPAEAEAEDPTILAADDPLSLQAFARQR